MISLNKFMAEVKNKLKRLEDKRYVKDSLSLSGTWTAPHDGIVTCSGRATAAGAYLFCKDLTENEYIGLCTIGVSNATCTFIRIRRNQIVRLDKHCSSLRIGTWSGRGLVVWHS